MKVYKGTNKDMKCTPVDGVEFQYEIGKTYEKPKAELCKHGFHACEAPLDVFRYYPPADGSRYFEAELNDVSPERKGDSKVCGKKITIGAEIGIPGLVKAHFEYVKTKCEEENSATGDWSANSATGNGSANSATGYGSANVSTGVACKNSGGNATINVGWGKDNKCKGELGAYLVCSEWGDWNGNEYPLIAAKMAVVDGESIKPDTWYTLKDGEFVEV